MAAADLTKVGWALSAPSAPGQYFRVGASAVAEPPPKPIFSPAGTPPFGPAPERRLPAGAWLDFSYACVSWASALVLERWEMDGEGKWEDQVDPVLVVGEAAQAGLVVPPSGRWRYQLRADSAAGASRSVRLKLRVV